MDLVSEINVYIIIYNIGFINSCGLSAAWFIILQFQLLIFLDLISQLIMLAT